jgi:hypothetical protein
MPPHVFVPHRAGNRQPLAPAPVGTAFPTGGRRRRCHPELTLHGTITVDADGWVAYVRLEDPPGLSPITTVGHFDTVEGAQVATDEVWASR